MVHFPSREIKDYREVPGDLPQDWKGWEKGEQPMTAWARPFEPDAVQYRLRQGKFFSDDYLTITGTSRKLKKGGAKVCFTSGRAGNAAPPPSPFLARRPSCG